MHSPLATSHSRTSASSARALELHSPSRGLRQTPQTPFREDEPARPTPQAPLGEDAPLDAVSLPPGRFLEAAVAAADTQGPGSALPQVSTPLMVVVHKL